uniref:Uncharacterized protein n=1 Tax=Anopheles atroparvus TaxID=41427 RepID=A0AAG5DJM8_ANOAO
MAGAERADSLNFNLHKWMFVNFDCCAMWFKDAGSVTQSFSVDRIYLQHQFQGHSKAPDYRHWQIQLGRRFRSLKVWITLRTMGAEKIRQLIRFHIQLANRFEQYVRTDDRFEVLCSTLALVCFRLKGDDARSKQLLENITRRKKIFMIPATYQGKFIIRFMICGIDPQMHDIEYAWDEVRTYLVFESRSGKTFYSETEYFLQSDHYHDSSSIISYYFLTCTMVPRQDYGFALGKPVFETRFLLEST